jgi:hypothetical protein
MFNLLLGGAVVGAVVFVFWSALPVDGKMRPWITPGLEPYVTVGLIVGGAVGLLLLGVGASSIAL